MTSSLPVSCWAFTEFRRKIPAERVCRSKTTGQERSLPHPGSVHEPPARNAAFRLQNRALARALQPEGCVPIRVHGPDARPKLEVEAVHEPERRSPIRRDPSAAQRAGSESGAPIAFMDTLHGHEAKEATSEPQPRRQSALASRPRGPATTKHPCCTPALLDYVPAVDWQQLVSLIIVGLAGAALSWSRFRPRKFSFERDTHCGCSAATAASSKSSIVFRARKGERPQVTVKMK